MTGPAPTPQLEPIYVAPHRLPGYNILVDNFRVRSERQYSYFLTHFHQDHYDGLYTGWDRGNIYGSPTTIALVQMKFAVSARYLHTLEYNTYTSLTPDLSVLSLRSSHCAGSVMLLFKNTKNEKVLFTGDFRFDRTNASSLILQKYLSEGITQLHIDMTFCTSLEKAGGSVCPMGDVLDKLKTFILTEELSEETLRCFPNPVPFSRAKSLKDLNVDHRKALFVITTCFPGRERLIGVLCNMLHISNVATVPGWRALGLQEGLKEFGYSIQVLDWNFFREPEPPSQVVAIPMRTANVAETMAELLAQTKSKQYETVVHIHSSGWDTKHVLSVVSATPKERPNAVHISLSYTEHSDLKETLELVRLSRPKVIRCCSTSSFEEERDLIRQYLRPVAKVRNK